MNEQKFQKDVNLFMKSQGISSNTLSSYQKFQNGYINPQILEERQLNVTSIDVFSRLMLERIIWLGTGITDDVSNIINSQLLFLESVDPTKDVNIFCNCCGGEVISGLSIVDTMEFIKPNVNTTVTGLSASMSFVISTCGVHRSSLKHSRFLLHQPLGGASGQQTDIEIVANEIKKTKQELYEIISQKTGKPIETIYKDGDRDYWMNAEEALKYGAIDTIIGYTDEQIKKIKKS